MVSVDGVLSALDWEGRQVWSYQLAEPLFSSTLNYKVGKHVHVYIYMYIPIVPTYFGEYLSKEVIIMSSNTLHTSH